MAVQGARRTAFVVLEYCGGIRTDALHRELSAWNPGAPIHVLDNASPANHATCVTHQNRRNSYIGGGIRDCLRLARKLGAEYLFYCVNDIEFLAPLVIADFESIMMKDSKVVVVSCALAQGSQQGRFFPWMAQISDASLRRVRFVDPICCLIRLDFIDSFGGFPPSKGGWGYSSEMAYHAKQQGLKLYVNDRVAVLPRRPAGMLITERGEVINKRLEAARVYGKRYGDLAPIRATLAPPGFDETLDVPRPRARSRARGRGR